VAELIAACLDAASMAFITSGRVLDADQRPSASHASTALASLSRVLTKTCIASFCS
jgi:hypothetical protein